MKDLDELKRLLAAATPGPWEPWLVNRLAKDMDRTNSVLIVAAVNALPDLIARVERAEAAQARTIRIEGATPIVVMDSATAKDLSNAAAFGERCRDEEALRSDLALNQQMAFDLAEERIARLEAALREADKLADADCVAHPDFCQCLEPIQRKLEEICSAALEPEK